VPEPVRQDSGKRRAHASDEVEHCISLLEFVARVPARQEICASLPDFVSTSRGANSVPKTTYREETSLEDSENDTERNQFVPLLDKAEADHCSAPEDCDGWEECAWAQFSEHDCGRRLQHNITDEEDEDDDRIAFSD
jgi:hypothetical protein